MRGKPMAKGNTGKRKPCWLCGVLTRVENLKFFGWPAEWFCPDCGGHITKDKARELAAQHKMQPVMSENK